MATAVSMFFRRLSDPSIYVIVNRMPDKRSHRGPGPKDLELFAESQLPSLRQSATDYIWLLSRGYAEPSVLKLIGDRYGLEKRQRMAVMRSACSDQQLENRQKKQSPVSGISGNSIIIDGYNLLITLEAALSGGVLLQGRDGSIRDLSGIHGTWRRVEETMPAIHIAGQFLEKLDPSNVLWLLDRPVSNSGRLKVLLLETAQQADYSWQVELEDNPDSHLKTACDLVVTSDSAILDQCGRWVNLSGALIQHLKQQDQSLFLVDLFGDQI